MWVCSVWMDVFQTVRLLATALRVPFSHFRADIAGIFLHDCFISSVPVPMLFQITAPLSILLLQLRLGLEVVALSFLMSTMVSCYMPIYALFMVLILVF